jgi:hypothetical protein
MQALPPLTLPNFGRISLISQKAFVNKSDTFNQGLEKNGFGWLDSMKMSIIDTNRGLISLLLCQPGLHFPLKSPFSLLSEQISEGITGPAFVNLVFRCKIRRK